MSVGSSVQLPLRCEPRTREHHRGLTIIGGSTTNPGVGAYVASGDTTQDVEVTTVRGGEGAARWAEGERRVVWEEHWDDARQAPFYRLSGHDLALWQIPAL